MNAEIEKAVLPESLISADAPMAWQWNVDHVRAQ